MALSAKRTTIDATNTATKTIALQNDFLRSVSITHRKLGSYTDLMQQDGILVRHPTNLLNSQPEPPDINLSWRCHVWRATPACVRRSAILRSVSSMPISGKTFSCSSIPIELVIAHAAAAHPFVPGCVFLGEAGKHECCRPHIELSAGSRRCDVLFRRHKQPDLDR
jgi:hypothetical protein